MNTKIYFTIRTGKKFEDEYKDIETDFMLEYDERGTCVDGQARNPCSAWTNYTTWDHGWSEQDKDLEILWGAIKEFSKTSELEQIIGEIDKTDINQEYKYEYTCEDFCEPQHNIGYEFTITICDIEEYDDE